MNVLADRHHSGLFRSLQLLAERLGWTLHAPAGQEWWDEGYWSFGRWTYGDDRLARQFLGWTERDPEYPDVPIRYVTLAEAQAMDWGIVIASVPDNEPGFARFAREQGAQYVLQVGNTGQEIDWSLDPVALVSSEMPIRGRGVVYHQEMEPVAFAPPPTDFASAASFVNCMPSMGECWDILQRSPLPVAVYGIDSEVIKPYSRLIEIMGSVGFGWHCKAQGDGFGHVVHSWAAVGRPLIGHASHYAGRMAAPFWEDGVTCIDLDRHDAAAVIEYMDPDTYRKMCRTIRERFDDIDHETEARSIAELMMVPA